MVERHPQRLHNVSECSRGGVPRRLAGQRSPSPPPGTRRRRSFRRSWPPSGADTRSTTSCSTAGTPTCAPRRSTTRASRRDRADVPTDEAPTQRPAVPRRHRAHRGSAVQAPSRTPEALWGPLPMPPMGSTEEESRDYEEPFNRRARYRYRRLAGPDAEGTARYLCPIEAGFLRSRQVPETMRKTRDVPLVELPTARSAAWGPSASRPPSFLGGSRSLRGRPRGGSPTAGGSRSRTSTGA